MAMMETSALFTIKGRRYRNCHQQLLKDSFLTFWFEQCEGENEKKKHLKLNLPACHAGPCVVRNIFK